MDLSTKKQIFLKKGELIEVSENAVVGVNNGTVWLTFAGDKEDYVLKSGEQITCEKPKPVIEAIESSYIVICEDRPRFNILGLIGDWTEEGLR